MGRLIDAAMIRSTIAVLGNWLTGLLFPLCAPRACVKVLIDESIQQAITDLLVQEGHDALHVVARWLGGASDDQGLAAAKRDGRILVTADTDFGDLLALSG